MRTHCSFGPVRVSRLQRRDDLPVLAVGALGTLVKAFCVVVEDGRWQLQGRGQDFFQPRAVGCTGNDAVELIVELIKARQVLVPAQLGKNHFQLVLDGLEPRGAPACAFLPPTSRGSRPSKVNAAAST